MSGLYYALMDLQGQVAVITGASSRLDSRLRTPSRQPARRLCLARRADRLQQAVDAICQSGGRAHAVAMDVTSEADMQRLVGAAWQNVRAARHHDL